MMLSGPATVQERNQHGWTIFFNVTATINDENSPERQHFVGYFRINLPGLIRKKSMDQRIGTDLFDRNINQLYRSIC